jgi:antitoxin component YwqK of YwqJK toxin-antitoxin module
MGIGNFNSSKRPARAGCLRENGPALLNLVNEFGQEIRMKQRIDRHKDGSIRARGHVIDEMLAGYWEWFRKDGTKMRSGYFENGKQVGEWTTYDAKGKVVKITKMRSPAT